MRMIRRAATVLTIGAGVVLAGCGGDDDGNDVAGLDTDGILAEAQAAMDEAESVHIAGTIDMGGESTEIDVTYGPDGAVGTVGIMGVDLELLRVEGDVYMRGNAELWDAITGESGAGAQLADQYVSVPADDPRFAQLTDFVNFDVLVDTLLEPEGEVTKGEETEVNGQAVIGVADEDGSTLYVATTGEALPVQVTPAEGESGALDFEWGVDVDVTAPDQADIMDLTEIL